MAILEVPEQRFRFWLELVQPIEGVPGIAVPIILQLLGHSVPMPTDLSGPALAFHEGDAVTESTDEHAPPLEVMVTE